MNGPEDLPLEILERAQALGFLGPGSVEIPRAHAGGFAEVIEETLDDPPQSLVDLGSGGGLPGLVLAARWRHCRVSLIESNHRRSEHLRAAVTAQGWDERVTVIEERAEVVARDPERREQFQVATARSFAEPAVTAEIAAGLVMIGGLLVVSEPPERVSARWPEAELGELGFGAPAWVAASGANFVGIRKVRATPAEVPRGVGRPAKRPRW